MSAENFLQKHPLILPIEKENANFVRKAIRVIGKNYSIQYVESETNSGIEFTIACSDTNFAGAYFSIGVIVATLIKNNQNDK